MLGSRGLLKILSWNTPGGDQEVHRQYVSFVELLNGFAPDLVNFVAWVREQTKPT
jgi:hypothetical protein